MLRPAALALCALPLLVSQAHAEAALSDSLTPTGNMAVASRLAADHDRAITMRNAGIALTVIGLVGTAIGASYTLFSIGSDDGPTASRNEAIGMPLLVVGQVSTAVGIPLWAVGGARAKKAERARLAFSATSASLTF